MASDSSATTTPMLTPDSTGSGSSSSPDPSTAKKARRQAVYPNTNSSNKLQKPFSRSAAKRESVMALGSIEHLQHYFTKTGIAAKKNPLAKPFHGLVPAIGGPTHIRTSPATSISSITLPPSPDVPVNPRPAFPPYIKTYDIDPESLLSGVVEDLSAVTYIWQLETHPPSQDNPDPGPALSSAPIDVLGTLKATTRAIRSIRNYLVSLPDESAGEIRANFRPTLLGPVGKAAAAASSSSSATPDPLTLIRRSALEVLTVLREMEENCRLPLSDDAYDRQSEGGPSRVASPSHGSEDLRDGGDPEGLSGRHEFAADVAITFMHVNGRNESIPVWENEEDSDLEVEEEKEKREHWDERLDVRSGWLYRQNVTLRELGKERKVVAGYLDVVDGVLFEWKKDETKKERGWEREKQKAILKGDKESLRQKSRRTSDGGFLGMSSAFAGEGKRRVSTGMLNMSSGSLFTEEPEIMGGIQEDAEEEETADDEDLPEWAQRGSFPEDDLGRAHALLSDFLPSHLFSELKPPAPRSTFLSCLSSGQLLCVAYNSCVRKSKHPWGYVSKDGIHDIIALENAEREKSADKKPGEAGKKVWTFRRTDNLRLWAGALKLRYMIPLQVPTQTLSQSGASGPGTSTPLPSPRKASHRPTEPVIVFDAKIVARKDEGWEDMLEIVLLQWVRKVVDERRRAR